MKYINIALQIFTLISIFLLARGIDQLGDLLRKTDKEKEEEKLVEERRRNYIDSLK